VSERPAFEINDLKGRHIKIYASGRTEGLEDMEPRCIFNRIPALVGAAVAEALADKSRGA
jgi:hypothetical protein